MPAGTYKKAHRHGPGYHVMCVAGSGFSLTWHDGDKDFIRTDSFMSQMGQNRQVSD